MTKQVPGFYALFTPTLRAASAVMETTSLLVLMKTVERQWISPTKTSQEDTVFHTNTWKLSLQRPSDPCSPVSTPARLINLRPSYCWTHKYLAFSSVRCWTQAWGWRVGPKTGPFTTWITSASFSAGLFWHRFITEFNPHERREHEIIKRKLESTGRVQTLDWPWL